MEYKPYNPLDKKHLAESILGALEARDLEMLPPEDQITGAGVYALYYMGANPIYAPLVKGNASREIQRPIYVGKAVPPGGRKGGFDLAANVGKDVFKRLNEHAKSIEQVKDLALKDFRCRYLMVDDIWIPLGEQLFIDKYQPVWNVLLEGFGIHQPGSGRNKQARSLWDEVHPGRTIARGLPPNKRDRSTLLKETKKFWTDMRDS